FTPAATGRLDVSLSFLHLNGDIDVVLRDTAGNFLAGSAGVVDGESFSANVLAGQQYVLHVYGFAGAINVDYSMSLNVVAVPTVLTQGFHYLSAPQRLTYQFSENVSASLSTADLMLQNLTTSTTVPPGSIALSYDPGTNTATFSFPGFAGGILPDANYRATLLAAGVTNSSGTPMAANVITDFFTLAGDANRDRIVNIRDLAILTANWLQSPRNFSQADFNYDTFVDRLDLDLMAMRWQAALPAPASPPPLTGSSQSPQPPKRIATPLFSAERIAEDELLTMLG
ncbi:MAG TPA: dockerin type I domain-containing protein, partial [Tepidisphaeraceae bacterium]|nr:dockerin type I domain-containing protein [Tepidisphaeraceae bacterium]